MQKWSVLFVISLSLVLFLVACAKTEKKERESSNIEISNKIEQIIASEQKKASMQNPNDKVDYTKSKLKTIYLAGGCFWGLEAYMERIYGVANAVSGYANGKTENPSYEDLIHKHTGHAETVKVDYDPNRISLEQILNYYLLVVDPTSLNKQGNDRGEQYRSGVYYTDSKEEEIIKNALKKNKKNTKRK